VIHPLRALSFIVLAVVVACQAPLPTSERPTTAATATGSPGQPTSSDQPTTSGPPAPTPTPTPTPVVTINHQDDNESVVLEVPAPQIPPGVTIDVEDHPLRDAPRDVRDAGVRQAFHVLTPQDLTFAEPARVTITMPRAAFTRPDGSLALAVPAIRTPDGDWDWLADPEMTVSADAVEMTGLTSHLGSVFVWTDLTDLNGVGSSLGPQPVGQPFWLSLSLAPQEQRPNPVTIKGSPDYAVEPAALLVIGAPRNGPIDRTATCRQTGSYQVTLTTELENFGADTPFLTETLHLPPTDLTLHYLMDGVCVIPAPTAPPPTAPASSPSPSVTPSSSATPPASPSASPSPSPSASPTPKSKPSKSP
jgi:hypothetical protein